MDKLFHYSKDKIDKLEDRTYAQEPMAKPNGLWFSPSGEYGWKEWCEEEQFRLETFTYKYRVKLKSYDKILILDTPESILKFSKQYKLEIVPGIRIEIFIDWPTIATKYSGIIISPYQWSLRLHPRTHWYYGFDCASGCIWDLSVIESFTQIRPQLTARLLSR